MDASTPIYLKKNLLFSPERDQSQVVENARVFTWDPKMPWYCTSKRLLMATVRAKMMLAYDSKGDYQLSYIQDLDPQLHRMRWTCRMIAFDSANQELFDFLVDTRELTVHPVTKSWVYQIHTGAEVNIARHLDKIAWWERDLSGNGWFKEN